MMELLSTPASLQSSLTVGAKSTRPSMHLAEQLPLVKSAPEQPEIDLWYVMKHLPVKSETRGLKSAREAARASDAKRMTRSAGKSSELANMAATAVQADRAWVEEAAVERGGEMWLMVVSVVSRGSSGVSVVSRRRAYGVGRTRSGWCRKRERSEMALSGATLGL